jgi:hypothetical protein
VKATSINLGYIGEQASPITYAYGGMMNGDGVRFNDLLFIPNNGSDIRFSAITGTTPLLKHSKQHLKHIKQDPYLSTRRGQYVERNGFTLCYID